MEGPGATTIGDLTEYDILPILKKLSLRDAISMAASSKKFREVLEPEDHPEYVSFIRQLEGKEDMDIYNKQDSSVCYSSATKSLVYVVKNHLYILNIVSGEVKRHALTPNYDYSIYKSAFNDDGSILTLCKKNGDIILYKYDSREKVYQHLKTHPEPGYDPMNAVIHFKTTVINDIIYILFITRKMLTNSALNKFIVYSTTMNDQHPFERIYDEFLDNDLHMFYLDVSHDKVLIMTSSGCKTYVIRPTGQIQSLGEINNPFGILSYPSAAFFHPNDASFIVLSTSVRNNTYHIQSWKWRDENQIVKDPVLFNDVNGTIGVDRRLEKTVALSPNGKYLAVISKDKVSNIESLYKNPSVELWEVASGKHIRTVELKLPKHTIQRIIEMGFYEKDGKQWVFVIDEDLKQYAFKPELEFFGGARKTRSSKK